MSTPLPVVKCPLCQRDLPEIAWNTQAPLPLWAGGPPGAFLTFFCPHCRGVLGCQLVPIAVTSPSAPPSVAIGLPRVIG